MLPTVIKISCLIPVVVMLSACAAQYGGGRQQLRIDGVDNKPAHYNEAITAAKAGRIERAIQLLKKITRENPDYDIAYTDLGLQYLRRNNLDEAEKAFEKSISLNSSNFVAYNHQGIIMRARGDFPGAEDMYKTAIKYNPDYANAHLNIAVLYDIYMYDLEPAMFHYKKYQSLTRGKDKLVDKWLVDLKRRISSNAKKSDKGK